MKMRSALCVAVFALSLPLVAAEKSPVSAGKWQVSVQTEIPGMPFKMPAIKTTVCVTPEQAENPEATLPKGNEGKNSSCKVSDYKINGNTITWTMDCPKEKMTGEGEMTYAGESYTGSMKIKTGDTEMVQKYTGKLLGACDK